MIKAIVFDWGGVLIDKPEEGLMEYCAKSLKIKKRRLVNIFSKYKSDFEKGIIAEKEMWSKICRTLGIAEPKAVSLWEDAVKHVFKDKKEVYELVRKLRKNGYKVGFLSNTELPAMKYLLDNNYGAYFDVAVFSCVEKTVKPEEEIYRIVLERLEIDPHDAIFIDDKPKHVNGARKAKMNGIVFQNVEQLKKELKAFAVKID